LESHLNAKTYLKIGSLPIACLARAGGHPEKTSKQWIPASAGMTASGNKIASRNFEIGSKDPPAKMRVAAICFSL
jgi:hypothetical protein